MSSKPNNSNGAAQAGSFRRQPSLNVSGANPVLTVAISPASKVDYSVTKGGARTWIVLLVFVLLCSSLHTIFSAKDLEDISQDVNLDSRNLDDDESSNNSGLFTKRQDDDDDDDDDDRPSLKQQAPPVPVAADSDDEDDEETVEHSLGGRLFASLKKKMSNRLRGRNDDEPVVKKVKPVKQAPPPKKQKKPEPVKEVKEEVEDDDDDDDDDNNVVEEPVRKKIEKKTFKINTKEKKEPPKKDVKHKKYAVVEEEEDDDDDDDDDDDIDGDENSEKDENDDNDDEDDDDEEEDVKEKEEKKDVKKKEGEEDKKENDDDEDENEEEERQVSPKDSKKQKKLRKRKQDTCVHVDCENVKSAQPRKSLLMKKRKSNMRSVSSQLLEDDDDDDDEDDDDDDEDDDDDDDEVQINKVEDNDEDYDHIGRDERGTYRRHAITTKEEHGFRDILDRADQLVEKHDYASAMELFDHVLTIYPYSSRALFGKARAFDIRGEIELNEEDRHHAIRTYEKILENPTTPDALFKQAADRLIEQTRFCGLLHRTLQAHRVYIDRFPQDVSLQTDFATTFIMMKRYEEARTILKNVIAIDPNNVIALAYYGYILKAQDNQIEQGVALMRRSLKLANDEIKDPKFYYQLGHGLVSLGKRHEAEQVYAKAAEMGVFLNAQQRSLYNIDGLTARPWWSIDQTPYSKFLKTVERQWSTIKLESMSVLKECSDCWLDHNQQLIVDGQWKYYPIMSEQTFVEDSCERMPQTCSILRDFRASSNASKSEMYLSVLSSGAKIMPHCGPTNYHLQAHLGLVVPSEARIRVANETKGWKSGKFVIFDDSFEHELEFDGASSSSFRLVLVLQLWHPGVQPHQRVISFLS